MQPQHDILEESTVEPTQRDDQEPASPTPPELSGKGAARRRIGLGASGLIMTLASKPGMAGNPMYCGSVSGWNSASTASKTKTSGGKCMGRDSIYWSNNTWPSSCKRSTMFSTIFPEGRNTLYTDSTMYNVCTHTDTNISPGDLRREFVVAYMNAVMGNNTHPSTLELKQMWKEYASSRNFKVASTGQILSGDQIRNFLAASHE